MHPVRFTLRRPQGPWSPVHPIAGLLPAQSHPHHHHDPAVHDLRANSTLLDLSGTRWVDLNLTIRNIIVELYETNVRVYSHV